MIKKYFWLSCIGKLNIVDKMLYRGLEIVLFILLIFGFKSYFCLSKIWFW